MGDLELSFMIASGPLRSGHRRIALKVYTDLHNLALLHCVFMLSLFNGLPQNAAKLYIPPCRLDSLSSDGWLALLCSLS